MTTKCLINPWPHSLYIHVTVHVPVSVIWNFVHHVHVLVSVIWIYVMSRSRKSPFRESRRPLVGWSTKQNKNKIKMTDKKTNWNEDISIQWWRAFEMQSRTRETLLGHNGQFYLKSYKIIFIVPKFASKSFWLNIKLLYKNKFS